MQDSLVEAGSIETAKGILAKSESKLILPVDAVIADKFEPEAQSQVVDVDKVPAGWRVMDVGPKTLELYKQELAGAKLVVWNGPVGVFEMPKFAEGTFALAKLLAGSGATTVIGGGDSASAVKKAGVAKQMTHVSTGGGASLEFLEEGTPRRRSAAGQVRVRMIREQDAMFPVSLTIMDACRIIEERPFTHDRNPFVAGNWKMNKTIAEARDLALQAGTPAHAGSTA
jgi:hypothetical protein